MRRKKKKKKEPYPLTYENGWYKEYGKGLRPKDYWKCWYSDVGWVLIVKSSGNLYRLRNMR